MAAWPGAAAAWPGAVAAWVGAEASPSETSAWGAGLASAHTGGRGIGHELHVQVFICMR